MPFEICTHPWKFYVEPFRIAGNLYYVGNADVSSHLIDTGQGLILIDTGFPQTLYLLLESIRRLGFNPYDVQYILHSHGHYDHFGGTRALVELTGAKTALGAQDLEVLKSRPELSWAPEYGVNFYETFEVDISLINGQLISLGNTSIFCIHTPGHTSGTMSFFLEIEVDGAIYTAGIHGGPGLNTLTTKFLKENDLPVSNRTDYEQSLQRLREQEVDIFFAAHPDQNDTFIKQSRISDTSNPFIDKLAWPNFLDKMQNEAEREFKLDPL